MNTVKTIKLPSVVLLHLLTISHVATSNESKSSLISDQQQVDGFVAVDVRQPGIIGGLWFTTPCSDDRSLTLALCATKELRLVVVLTEVNILRFDVRYSHTKIRKNY